MTRRIRPPMDPSGEILSDEHWPLPDKYYYVPEKFIAIHRARLIYLGAGEAGTLWSAVQSVATGRALVFGTTVGIYAERVYDCFTEDQLLTLWMNTNKSSYTGTSIRTDCLELGRRILPLATPKDLLNYDPANPPTQDTLSSPIPQCTNHRRRLVGTCVPTNYIRPQTGTKTGLVWDVSDDILRRYPSMTKRQLKDEVLSECGKRGINKSTVQVQFNKWSSQKSLTNG